MYRELDELTGEADLKQFTGQLTDRFGELPGQTRELLLIVPLRQKAGELGIERIMLKKNRMVLYFISDPESSFYQSAVFSGILNYVQQNPRKCSMKENNGKLTLTFTQVAHVHQALGILQTMTKQITK